MAEVASRCGVVGHAVLVTNALRRSSVALCKGNTYVLHAGLQSLPGITGRAVVRARAWPCAMNERVGSENRLHAWPLSVVPAYAGFSESQKMILSEQFPERGFQAGYTIGMWSCCSGGVNILSGIQLCTCRFTALADRSKFFVHEAYLLNLD